MAVEQPIVPSSEGSAPQAGDQDAEMSRTLPSEVRSAATTPRLCDVKGCGKEATARVREVEHPKIGVPVCETHAFALTLGDFYEREEAS